MLRSTRAARGKPRYGKTEVRGQKPRVRRPGNQVIRVEGIGPARVRRGLRRDLRFAGGWPSYGQPGETVDKRGRICGKIW